MAAECPTNIIILQRLQLYLKRHNLWDVKDQKNKRSYVWHYTKSAICLSYFSTLWIMATAHMMKEKKEKYQIGVEDDMVTITTSLTLMLVCFSFLWKNYKFELVMRELSTFGTLGKPHSLERLNDKINRLSTVLYNFAILSAVVYGGIPLLEEKKCRAYIKKFNATEICGLFTPVLLPFNIDFTPVRQIFNLYQTTAAISGLVPSFMIGLLTAGIHSHFALRLRHLRSQVKYISAKRHRVKQRVRMFVECHQDLIRLMDQMNECTSDLLCTHVFLTSTVTVIILRQIFHSSWKTPLGPAMHLSAWIISLYLNCLGGQQIIDESSLIGDEIYYNLNWYELDVSSQKDLLLIITRLNRHLIVTTGAFGFMSLSLFQKVLQGAYTFALYILLGWRKY